MVYYLKYGFSNKSKSMLPRYICGYNPTQNAEYVPWGGTTMSTYTCKFGWPLPVVPVGHIIDLINSKFDIKFDLVKEIDFSGKNTVPNYDIDGWITDTTLAEYQSSYNTELRNAINDDSLSKIFDLGVVTCVTQQIPDEISTQYLMVASGLVYAGSYGNTSNTYGFTFTVTPSVTNLFYCLLVGTTTARVLVPRFNFESIKVYGEVIALFKYSDISGNIEKSGGYYVQKVNGLEMTFRQEQGNNQGESLATVNGIFLGVTTIDNVVMARVSFDLDSQYGVSEAKLESLALGKEMTTSEGYPAERGIFVTFDLTTSDTTKKVKPESFESCNLTFYPYFDEGGRPHFVNATYALPEITCIEFMKALYYMDGGYPKLNDDGSIGIMHISDIEANISTKNVYDWSDKIIDNTTISISPNSNYAQHNYMLAGSDDEDDDEDEDGDGYTDDGFEVYKFDMPIDNNNLSEKSTIIKLPFYAPYGKNVDFTAYEAGNTTDYWKIEEVYRKNAFKVSAQETKPFLGYIKANIGSSRTIKNEHYNGTIEYANFLSMEPWVGFKNNNEYKILAKILKSNTLIKAKFNLSVVELSTIDYTKPIYIEKFNSYFVAINIDWSSETGLSEVELIKIPY